MRNLFSILATPLDPMGWAHSDIYIDRLNHNFRGSNLGGGGSKNEYNLRLEDFWIIYGGHSYNFRGRFVRSRFRMEIFLVG